MNGGYVTGGWGFVWAAYGWTAIVLTLYAVTIITRLRAERSRSKAEGRAR